MTFMRPWILLCLAPVAIVALLTLFRPRRSLVIVASLELWVRALSSAASSDSRRRRRTSLSWWLLLVGAVAAVLGAAGAVRQSSGPIRSVAIALHPSAELGPDGIAEMRLAAEELLKRLDPEDRVELIGPELLPPQVGPMSPGRAREKIESLSLLPVCSADLSVARSTESVGRTYHFAVETGEIAAGPIVTRIDIPTRLPAVTIDDVGAELIAPDRVQVFVALRNNDPRDVTAVVSAGDALGGASSETNVSLAANSRKSVTLAIPPAEAITVAARVGDSRAAAYLVRPKTSASRVAIIGRDDPYLRRFIEVDPSLMPVADSKDAKIVIANGVSAPDRAAALVIDPPSPPQGWGQSADPLDRVMLADAGVAADDPIMRRVDLSAAAIRRTKAWISGEAAAGKVLISSYKGLAIAVRTDDAADASGPRRVYLAFDISEHNCTLVRSEAYVVLLANIMRFLAPGSPQSDRFEYLTPLQAGSNPAWKPIIRDEAFDAAALAPAGLTAPGVHRDPSGRLSAVSLVGLRSGGVHESPRTAASSAPLPERQSTGRGMDLWPVLLVAAGLLWLAGWAAGALLD